MLFNPFIGYPYGRDACESPFADHHPRDVFDRDTLADLRADFARTARCGDRHEIVKFWRMRHQCPICQAGFSGDVETFSLMTGELYTQLARFDGVFNIEDYNRVVQWSEQVFDAAAEIKSSGNEDGELPPIGGSQLLEEVGKLAIEMLTPFDYNHEVQAIIWQSVPGWVAKGTWRQGWAGVLEHKKTRPALEALAMDDTQFVWYFLGLSKAEGMPDPDNILHDTHWFASLIRNPSEWQTTSRSSDPAISMAASLLLRFARV